MHIQNLTIKNYRTIEDVSLTGLPPVVILFGLIRQGKTSALSAIHMLLFGWNEFTDQASAGKTPKQAPELVRDGAREAVITATVVTGDGCTYDVSLTIRTSAKGGQARSEWMAVDANGEIFETREQWFAAMGIDMQHALISAMPMRYLMSRDLSDALGAMLSAGISRDQIEELCGGYYTWLDEFARGRNLRLETAADYAALGTEAFKARTDAKRTLKEQTAVLEDLRAIQPPRAGDGRALTPDDIEGVETAIGGYDYTLAQLHEERGRAQSAADRPDPAEHDRAILASSKADEEAAKAEAVYQEAQVVKETTAEARRHAQSDHSAAQHDVAEALRKVTRAKNALIALEELGDACPTCAQPISDEIRATLAAPMRADLDVATKEHEAAAVVAAETLTAVETANTADADADRTVTEARNVANQRRDHAAALKRAIPAAVEPYDGRAIEDIDADIAVVTEKRAKALAAIDVLRDLKRRDEQEAYVTNAEAEIKRLDWAVRSFKDGELIKSLIGGGLDEWTARCNEALAEHGCVLHAQSEGKNVALYLEVPGKPPRPVAQCSNGERMLAAASIALAFADSGALVCIDNLNELDHVERRTLLLRLSERTQGGVWLAGAWQSSASVAGLVEHLAPAAVFEVAGGAVSVPVDAEVAV